MYATITSKDHVRNIQQDLQNMYFSDMYRDTILHCSDGSIYLSRLLTGLLFPFLKPSRCFQMLEEATLILPEYNKLEIEKSIFNLLGIKYSDQSQDAAFVAEWPKEIDKIIGTLHPTSPVKGYKNATKAVLHSAMTQETAVIHAASTDDERDDLRIVDGGDMETEEWRSASSQQDDTRKIHKKLKVQHYNNVNNKSRPPQPPRITTTVAHHPHPHATAVASFPAAVASLPAAVTTTVEIGACNPSGHGRPIEGVNMIAAHPQINHQTQYLQTSEIVMSEGEAIVGDNNQIVLPSPGFLCPLCNSLFVDKQQFDAHIRQNHNLYKCKHCEATFKRQRDLLDHGRVHSGHKLIKCDICDKDFTERGLLWHTERFHKVEIPTPPTPVPTPAPSEEPKTKSNSLQDTLDSSKPMKKRGLKSDVTDQASNPNTTQEQISPGKEKESPTSSPQEQEKAKQRNKALKTTATPDGKGNTEDPVYVKNNVYFSSSDSDPDDPSSGSVSERVKRKKTRSRHEEHCEKCGEAIPRRNIAEHRKACSGTASPQKPADTPTNNNNTANGGGETTPIASSIIATRSGGLSLTIPPSKNDVPQIKLTIAASPSVSATTPGKAESGGSGKKTTLRKLFSCSYCHKKFSYNSSMRVHEKVHLGGKPYHCDMCDAKFSNKFDLYAHEKEHSDQRPHKCDMCQETFKTEDNLRFHKMIHSAQEPITCKYCNKYFQTKQQLTEHEKVHTGPFKCIHCDISYDKATKLSSHIKSKHSKETAAAAATK